jgi:hypothetical protein
MDLVWRCTILTIIYTIIHTNEHPQSVVSMQSHLYKHHAQQEKKCLEYSRQKNTFMKITDHSSATDDGPNRAADEMSFPFVELQESKQRTKECRPRALQQQEAARRLTVSVIFSPSVLC